MSNIGRERLGPVIMLAVVAMLWTQRTYTTPFGGIFPDRVMGILVILSVLALILSFLKKPSTHPMPPKPGSQMKQQWFDLGVVGLILLLWVLLLRPLGFVLVSVVGFAGISIFLTRKKLTAWVIGKSVVYALILTYAFLLIFGKLLLVPLPVGTLFE